MVEAVKSGNCTVYSPLGSSLPAEEKKNTGEIKQFDIQEILNKIDNYTYTDEDKKSVDDKLVQDIRQKFDLSEDDVYELYKRGVNLEELDAQEMDHIGKAKAHSLDEEESDKEKQKDKEISTNDKIETIKQGNDSMYLNTLLGSGAVTINSLYENNFKGSYKPVNTNYTQDDVKNVLKLNDIAENSSNTWAANMLMMYGMGVDSTSVSKLQNIHSIVGSIDNMSADGLSGDEELMNDKGTVYQPEYIDRITDDMGMVTDEHIKKLIEEKVEVNIENLRESIHKNASEALNDKGAQENESGFFQGEGQNGGDNELNVQVEEVKRQILQIATKLTVEAAQKISAQMPLESSSLAEVADCLHQMEVDMATQALQKVQVPVTEENIQTIVDTMAATQQMDKHFVETVQIELETDETAGLNEIQAALDRYMENETPVERRFGETIRKVEGQIESLLESQGIEVTKENVQAAKALITNQMEVSLENIQNIHDIVLKLNTFLEEMTPMQAASMIKEGMNPYTASVNQMLTFIGDKQSEQLKSTVAETIVSMEHSGVISEEQKEGMIGLYRILQAVTNDKEAVMGYMFKNELPMTIENLQIAAKYIKVNSGIDVNVDDHFGEQESLTYGSKTARQMIDASNTESDKMAESVKVLENMKLPITEENITKMSKISAILYPYIKEQFKKDMGKFDGVGTLPESFKEKIDTVQNASPEVLEQMLKLEMPLTLNNIYWMEKVVQDPTLYGQLLDENGMLKQDLPEDLDELEETLDEICKAAKNSKEEATISGDFEKYRNYKQLEEIATLQKQRIEKEGLYQIPFVIDGERKLVSLYVYPDKENGTQSMDESHLKAMINYHTKHLGDVKAYVEIKGDQIGFKIEAENAKTSDALDAHKELLIKSLMSMGYNTQYSEYTGSVETEEKQAANKVYKESDFEVIV